MTTEKKNEIIKCLSKNRGGQKNGDGGGTGIKQKIKAQ